MLLGGECAVSYGVNVSFDCSLHGIGFRQEVFDETGLATRCDPKHVVDHQHLAIGIGAGANANHRCLNGLGDPCCQWRWYTLQQNRIGPGGNQLAGVLDHQFGVLFITALNLVAAKLVDELRGQPQVGAYGNATVA